MRETALGRKDQIEAPRLSRDRSERRKDFAEQSLEAPFQADIPLPGLEIQEGI